MITLNNFLSQQNLLYHSLDFRKLSKFLRENTIHGFSNQRYWKDGLGRKDNDPDYNTSSWYKGISTSRDMNFAKQWGESFIVLDQNKLKQDYKIVPYQWNYSIGADYVKDHKKEREEFVVTGSVDKIDTFNEIPTGAIKPLSKYIIGFYVSDTIITNNSDILTKLISEFEDLYLGTYTDYEDGSNYMNKQGEDISNIKKQLRKLN